MKNTLASFNKNKNLGSKNKKNTRGNAQVSEPVSQQYIKNEISKVEEHKLKVHRHFIVNQRYTKSTEPSVYNIKSPEIFSHNISPAENCEEKNPKKNSIFLNDSKNKDFQFNEKSLFRIKKKISKSFLVVSSSSSKSNLKEKSLSISSIASLSPEVLSQKHNKTIPRKGSTDLPIINPHTEPEVIGKINVQNPLFKTQSSSNSKFFPTAGTPKTGKEIPGLFRNILKKNETIENNETTKHVSPKLKISSIPICILNTKIDIHMKYYNISYFYNKSATDLKIICSSETQEYELKISIPGNYSTFDYIKKVIEPRLNIINEQLALDEPQKLDLAEGRFIKENGSGVIKIVRFYPRWKIEVTINDKTGVFEVADIKSNLPQNIDLNRDKHYILNLFFCSEKGINICLPMSYPLETVFHGKVENLYLQEPIMVIVVRVNYLNSYSFMVKSKELDYFPLIVDGPVIAKRIEKIRLTVSDLILFFKKYLCVQESFICLADESGSDIFQRPLKRTNKRIPSKMSHLEAISGTDMSDSRAQYFEESGFQSNALMSIGEGSNILQFRKSEEYANFMITQVKNMEDIEYQDRILLRTCLYRNNQIYQISVSISENDILNFCIRNGSEEGNLYKLSVSIDLISEKTGIEKQYVVPLGYFVVKSMLIIKEPSICYFDFSQNHEVQNKILDRITSSIKGYILRKKFNVKLKKIVGKKKVKLQGFIYTGLLYLGEDVLYLRLVKSSEVLGIDLNLQAVVKEGLFSSSECFFNNLKVLNLHLVEIKNKKKLTIDEKYVFKSDN